MVNRVYRQNVKAAEYHLAVPLCSLNVLSTKDTSCLECQLLDSGSKSRTYIIVPSIFLL